MRKILAALVLVFVCLTGFAGTAVSFEATGTVNLIVPYAAGGAVDLGARLFAKYAAKHTSANIVIVNIGGAAGIIGTAEVLKYGTDGSYMLALNPSIGYVSTPEKPIPFDIISNFQFCAMMVRDPRMLAIRKDDERFSNAREFIEYCKANPGVTVGSSGAGNVAYYMPYLMSRDLDLNMTVVAFDGTGEMKSAFLGAHVDAASLTASECAAMLANDQITVIANASEERSSDPMFADVPTVKELGADIKMAISRGFAFKAGTDESIIAYWSNIFEKVVNDPEFLDEAKNQGLPIHFLPYKEANVSATAEMEMYKKIAAGL